MARVLLTVAVCCVTAVLAGCSGGAPDLRDFNPLENAGDSALLKPREFFKFKTPEWARQNSADNIHLSATQPVPPDQLVSASGQCPAVSASAAPPAAPAPAPQPAATTPSNRLEPAGGPAQPVPILGEGIGLGMTECAVVRRAGTPSQVSISADKAGEREAVLTYAKGERPGIYHFLNGRLKVVDALPEQAAAEKKSKRRTARKSKRASHSRTAERMYVQ